MNALQQYQFNTHQLAVILDDHGEPWFIAKQVAEILEYSDAFKMTKKLDVDEKSNRQIGGLGPETGGRGIICINESGLYSAILTSHKPEAKRFKKWVTSEVLPAIRKTGGYQVKPDVNFDDYTQLQQQHMILLEKHVALLEQQQSAPPSFGGIKPWTADEDRRALTLKAQGLGATRIGLKLGRTGDSVRNRLRRLLDKGIQTAEQVEHMGAAQ